MKRLIDVNQTKAINRRDSISSIYVYHQLIHVGKKLSGWQLASDHSTQVFALLFQLILRITSRILNSTSSRFGGIGITVISNSFLSVLL